jgi:hypothetical protein
MTPEQFKAKLNLISTELSRSTGDLLLLGAKDLEGRMKRRIFNDGKNTAETKIGKYTSKYWTKKRSERGNQTGFVDLEFTGDLRNSMQVVKDKNSIYFIIINDKDFEKSKGQELIQGKKKGQSKMEIFTPSKKERTGVQNYIADLIDEKIDTIINKL